MRFGKTLKASILLEWSDNYIQYDKLKGLLRETHDGEEPAPWTEEDESKFVEALINEELEKVNAFHAKKGNELKDRTASCESKLEPLAILPDTTDGAHKDDGKKEAITHDKSQKILKEVSTELDKIMHDVNELEKFSRINFTGFLKAAKKHDRLYKAYKVRPLLQVRLSALPFNAEDYSPLLYRLSAMYSFIRQKQDKDPQAEPSASATPINPSKKYESHKFWVHPDNLLEVKTYILRRLPVLIYNPQSSKIADANRPDPTITSLYFDSPKFPLYNDKLDRHHDASSLRLRWYGQLADSPDIVLERKIVPSIDEAESTGIEERLILKEKYIQGFLANENSLEKSVQKLKDRKSKSEEDVDKYEALVKDMQTYIKDRGLQPMLRAVYTRTAFQIPGDDRVRVSLDTELSLIREDSLDADRPCRDPEDWHRHDIDDQRMTYPFHGIRKGEISNFPYALLEIKILHSISARSREWVNDLMTSHLIHEAPRFSKFVHGVAVLFDDNVNSFPFWLSDIDKDIRKDPEAAFEVEQEKLKKQSEDQFAVGSLTAAAGGGGFMSGGSPSKARPNILTQGEPSRRKLSQSGLKMAADNVASTPVADLPHPIAEEDESTDEEDSDDREIPSSSKQSTLGGLRSLFPGFEPSGSKARRGSVALPPGVRKPISYLKNAGPVQVEAKVWLANQRTFIKWQHISVLLATLSLGLFNAAGKDNTLAKAIGIAFTAVAGFAGVWGWWMYMRRSTWIKERSGKDFDNSIGPVVVCVAMICALVINFAFKFTVAMEHWNRDMNSTTAYMDVFHKDTAMIQEQRPV